MPIDMDFPMRRKPLAQTRRRFFQIHTVLGLLIGGAAGATAETIELKLPVACEVGRTCFLQNYVDIDASPAAKDYRCGSLTYDGHNGTDFRLPSLRQSGVNVLAAARGQVTRVRDGVADGNFRRSGRESVRDMECGNGVIIAHADGWETQYCHMAKSSMRVKPGDRVAAGDELGLVGLSGMTEFPHLHFTVRHHGKTVDPFAYEAGPGCGRGKSLWASTLASPLAYRERTVLNTGFAGHPVTMEAIEEGRIDSERLTGNAPALVSFIRVIGLQAGDAQKLTLKDPAGRTIAENRATIERNKAQSMLFAGKKRPEKGWDRGLYAATYVVERDGSIVLEKSFSLLLSN